MQSVSVYEVEKCLWPFSPERVVPFETSNKEVVNGVDEILNFKLFINEDIENFKRCRIVMDEIHPIEGRVFQKDINSIIVNNAYDGFVNMEDGTLVILAPKKSADIISNKIQEKFELSYLRKSFRLQKIIDLSTNVKKTQFRGLKIETVQGSSLTGNRVTETDIYKLMLDAGELSNITVLYPFEDKEISFSISDSGSVVMLSNISDLELLDLIGTMLEIEGS